ncbi:PREDICTED: acylsugar acyltransferase 3-like [Nicotiana attenuata]|uniref:Acylsugar acyltransferase 3 n=1 Tax=Nicotiana attenuata TaxID=49451 RepID=A0A1J6IAW9_NICAT|nr:PREDICTED: acylsugar acyltransferase 3-like [Nicotiana attenuata]OIS97679.1 acylsugar acyltransferase 3 [Nicotiana attenuata]
MVASSLISLISKKIIKPSIPTPLRIHKLSFVDQVFHYYIPVSFFYPKNGNDKSYEPTHVSQLLEKSLSKTLSFYYPYAGRLKDSSTVDCNDAGVELSHVRVHCPMSEIFNHPYTNAEHVVFPVAQPHGHDEGNLAITQVSHFDCGGIAVGGCLSHKIGDGCTASSFFYNWGVLSRDISANLSRPHFVEDSIYPQSSDPSIVSKSIKSEEPVGYLGKRFVFPAAKVNALKAIFSMDSGVCNPTRTEVVTALLYKCAVAARRVNFGSFRPSSLFQVADMRQRLNPSLSHDASGNIISGFLVPITNEREMNCPRLVSEMRKEKEKLVDKDNIKKNAFISKVLDSLEKGKNNEFDDYFCSSVIALPLYKTDFGWGRPAKVSMATGPISKLFFLMDNQSGGGVEALVMLDKQDMSIFEKDPELLEFAIPAPNL